MGGDTSNLNQITPAKNIVSIPIESSSANIFVLVKTVCDSFPIESVKSIKNSFPFNMIYGSTYLLAWIFLFLKLVKKLLIIRN